MIIYPPLPELLEKVDCRYTLVIETAKRARQLVAGDAKLTEEEMNGKPVSIAVKEIYEDKITYENDKEEVK